MNEKYEGEEKRRDYCPVHNIKCGEIKMLQDDSKKRVPIWVFTIFAAGIFGVFSYLNVASIRRHEVVLESLSAHVEKSNGVLSDANYVLDRATHALNEVAFNQRTVMKKLDLEFEKLPDYQKPR